MKKLYVIEKTTGKIMISVIDFSNEFVEINDELFEDVCLYWVTEESKDIRFKYDGINPNDVYTITYSELLELLVLNNNNK